MTRLAKRMCSAVLVAGLVCGCILPASAAEAEEEARVLQYETAEPVEPVEPVQPVSAVVVDADYAEEEARVLQYETAGPVSAVKVNAEYAEVVIQPGQTDKITVFSYDCTVADGVLTVDVDGVEPKEYREYTQIGPFRILSSYMSPFYRNTVTITLPNKMYDSIQVETASGSIQLRGIQSQTAWLTTEYGDIVLSGTTKYGDVTGTIAGSQSSYSTSTAVEYGDSNLRAQIGDGVHALAFNTKYGDIDVDFTA